MRAYVEAYGTDDPQLACVAQRRPSDLYACVAQKRVGVEHKIPNTSVDTYSEEELPSDVVREIAHREWCRLFPVFR